MIAPATSGEAGSSRLVPLGVLGEPRGIALLGRFATPAGLNLPPELEFGDWATIGDVLAAMDKSIQWWVGDWWRFGEHRYGERAAAVLDHERWSYQTWANMGWVSGAFPLERRRESLSWSHHETVASLPPDEQERLLDKAQAEGLTRDQLRWRAKAAKREVEANGGKPPDPPVPDYRCPACSYEWSGDPRSARPPDRPHVIETDAVEVVDNGAAPARRRQRHLGPTVVVPWEQRIEKRVDRLTHEAATAEARHTMAELLRKAADRLEAEVMS